MRHVHHFLLCTAFFICVAGGGSSAIGQVFSLTIEPPTGPLKVGAEVRLQVTVKNIWNRAIDFITSPGQIPDDGLMYDIDVRDEQGRAAPRSAAVRNRDPHVPVNLGSRFSRSLQPGESFVDEVVVTRFFDLSKPGKYSISVRRGMPPRQSLGSATVKSNAITISVVK